MGFWDLTTHSPNQNEIVFSSKPITALNITLITAFSLSTNRRGRPHDNEDRTTKLVIFFQKTTSLVVLVWNRKPRFKLLFKNGTKFLEPRAGY